MFAIALASGCEDSGPRRLPPASKWSAPAPQPSRVGAAAQRTTGRDAEPHARPGLGDPHAGLDMNDPHAGVDMNDPHAGLDMNDPHAGVDMSGEVDPAMAGMEAPDPDRPIDRSKFLRGRIRAGGGAAGAVKPGAILFLSAWPVDPATGELLGAPVAVDKLVIEKLPVAFQLDESHMMVRGTRFDGDVMLTARVDGDGEARTKEPGDVEGQVKTRVPAEEIDLVLDTVLR
jgi:hypothetical protein